MAKKPKNPEMPRGAGGTETDVVKKTVLHGSSTRLSRPATRCRTLP